MKVFILGLLALSSSAFASNCTLNVFSNIHPYLNTQIVAIDLNDNIKLQLEAKGYQVNFVDSANLSDLIVTDEDSSTVTEAAGFQVWGQDRREISSETSLSTIAVSKKDVGFGMFCSAKCWTKKYVKTIQPVLNSIPSCD